MLHINFAIDRPHGAILDDVRRPIAEVHVGLEASEIDDEVSFVHPRDHRRRADRADVHAHVQRMVHRKRALAEHRGAYRRAELLRERDQLGRDL